MMTLAQPNRQPDDLVGLGLGNDLPSGWGLVAQPDATG
jgi:hypothetical protein